MRVGLVAKGLLLKGDLDLELVLLCKEKPTTALLDKVADNLAIQLAVSVTTTTGVGGWSGEEVPNCAVCQEARSKPSLVPAVLTPSVGDRQDAAEPPRCSGSQEGPSACHAQGCTVFGPHWA